MVINLLSFLTLLSNIFVVLFIVLHIFSLLKIYVNLIIKLIEKKGVEIAFILSLVATLGSLYFSEIALFEPCKLCWFQRIFMYPLVVILGVSLLKKTKDVFYYVQPLSAVGALIAIYHYYFQINPNPLAPCSSVGFSVSCNLNFFTHYGYITIPWMSFSAFLYIFLVSLVKLRSKNNS